MGEPARLQKRGLLPGDTGLPPPFQNPIHGPLRILLAEDTEVMTRVRNDWSFIQCSKLYSVFSLTLDYIVSAWLQKYAPFLMLSVAYEGRKRAIVSYVIRTTSLRGTQYEVRYETRGMPHGAFDAQGLGSIPEIKLEGEWGSSTSG
jgi:hypothetical protein